MAMERNLFLKKEADKTAKAEKELADELEKEIDTALQNGYTVYNITKKEQLVTRRIQNEIKRRYIVAGWTNVRFSQYEGYIVVSLDK